MLSRLNAATRILPLLLALPLSAHAADLASARQAVMQGRVDDAVAQLQTLVAANPKDAAAHSLLCRAYYAEDMPDPAIRECEAAVANAPTSSEYHMWLGRAYGQKAEHSGMFSGMSLAKKVHNAFERAVQLNPNNGEALSDLGEYYVAAPGVVGGGGDKATKLAEQMMAKFPARGHRLLALIAEKNKDFPKAEAEYKAAVAAGHSPEALVDLGRFFVHRGQLDLAVSTIQAAIAADTRRDAALVDCGAVLNEAHRQPREAEQALRDYLVSPNKSDAAPAFKVHLQLGHILSFRGDKTEARENFAAALALAKNYGPAQKAAVPH